MKLPERSTRGKRFKQLVAAEYENEADEEFWTQDAFQEHVSDNDFEEEEMKDEEGSAGEDEDEEDFDSDFDLNAGEGDDAENEAEGADKALQREERLEKQAARRKALRAVYKETTSVATSGRQHSRKRVREEDVHDDDVADVNVQETAAGSGISGDDEVRPPPSKRPSRSKSIYASGHAEPSRSEDVGGLEHPSKAKPDADERSLRASTKRRVEADEQKRTEAAERKKGVPKRVVESVREPTQEEKMAEALTVTAAWNEQSLQYLVDFERQAEEDRENMLRMRANRRPVRKADDPGTVFRSRLDREAGRIEESITFIKTEPYASRLTPEMLARFDPVTGEPKPVMCAVQLDVPAKYRDPLTLLPFAGKKQFEKLRHYWSRTAETDPVPERQAQCVRLLVGYRKAALSRSATAQRKKMDKEAQLSTSVTSSLSEMGAFKPETSTSSLMSVSPAPSPSPAAGAADTPTPGPTSLSASGEQQIE